MPDRKSKLKERQRREWIVGPARRARLYADEDIPVAIVAMLRHGGTNVLSTAEAGNRGKDDKSQVAYAAKIQRILVTRNLKHFLNDQLVPLRTTHGIIGLDVPDRDADAALGATAIITETIVPYAELYEHMKIRISTAGGVFRFIDRGGSARRVTLSLDELLDGRYPTDDYDGPPWHA